MSYDPLSHSRHSARDRSAKVGHKVIFILTTSLYDALDVSLCGQRLTKSMIIIMTTISADVRSTEMGTDADLART